ncbi:MAG: hypothetical protein ACTSW1_08965, partial [Candidatus Hodarchaeales archaeon]
CSCLNNGTLVGQNSKKRNRNHCYSSSCDLYLRSVAESKIGNIYFVALSLSYAIMAVTSIFQTCRQ